MHRILVLLVAVLLTAFATLATAQSGPDSSDERKDIERLVDTLEDPEKRAQLITDLERMLEAQGGATTDDAPEAEGTDSVLDVVKKMVTDTWENITAIDPVDVLISTAISVGILIAALVLRWLLLVFLRRLYARLTGVNRDDDSTELPEDSVPGDENVEESEKAALPGAISRLVNLIVGVLAIALIAESWGAGIAELLSTNLGSRIAETALAVGLILIATFALWNAASILVARLLHVTSTKLDHERKLRRMNTLVPLLTNTLQTTISIFAGLLILSELGINIAPLLAGAGILGLAIGFGAQTLVKDLITGVTILLEDAATIGDVIEVAGHLGVVEEMRIRIIQLRDLAGVVHIIPYSEVTTVKNYTKEFSYKVFEIGVAYRENSDRVCEILMEISEDLSSDATHGPNILEPLQILGVDQFADSAVIIKARLKTMPGMQWATGREFNRRMKLRFDEEGIEIPFPHTTIYFGEPKEGKAPPMQLALNEDQTRLLQKFGGDEKP
ncbi:MAG: mechanosensitive ion channel family protein [Woeseiaceae bacterium]|nr:mechanosensitive ion channel family protein [Woeseiaceae bacterium]